MAWDGTQCLVLIVLDKNYLLRRQPDMWRYMVGVHGRKSIEEENWGTHHRDGPYTPPGDYCFISETPFLSHRCGVIFVIKLDSCVLKAICVLTTEQKIMYGLKHRTQMQKFGCWPVTTCWCGLSSFPIYPMRMLVVWYSFRFLCSVTPFWDHGRVHLLSLKLLIGCLPCAWHGGDVRATV